MREPLPIWERPSQKMREIQAELSKFLDSHQLEEISNMIEDYAGYYADYREWSSDPDA